MKGFGKCVAVRICPQFWCCGRKMKSWLCHDEIRASSDEIFGVPPQMKSNPPLLSPRSEIPSQSDFIPRKWDFFRHRRISLKKALACASAFFWLEWLDSNQRDARVKVLCLTAWRHPNTDRLSVSQNWVSVNIFLRTFIPDTFPEGRSVDKRGIQCYTGRVC